MINIVAQGPILFPLKSIAKFPVISADIEQKLNILIHQQHALDTLKMPDGCSFSSLFYLSKPFGGETNTPKSSICCPMTL